MHKITQNTGRRPQTALLSISEGVIPPCDPPHTSFLKTAQHRERCLLRKARGLLLALPMGTAPAYRVSARSLYCSKKPGHSPLLIRFLVILYLIVHMPLAGKDRHLQRYSAEQALLVEPPSPLHDVGQKKLRLLYTFGSMCSVPISGTVHKCKPRMICSVSVPHLGE